MLPIAAPDVLRKVANEADDVSVLSVSEMPFLAFPSKPTSSAPAAEKPMPRVMVAPVNRPVPVTSRPAVSICAYLVAPTKKR